MVLFPADVSRFTRLVLLLVVLIASCTPQSGNPTPAPTPADPAPTPADPAPTRQEPETIYDTAGQAGSCAQSEERVVPPIEGTPLDDQVKTVARAVEILRDLEFEQEPRSRLLTEDAFKKRSRSLIIEAYTPHQAKIDARILVYLGLLPRGTDLLELSAEVAGEQISGFYLPKTKVLYVPREGENLDPFDEIVVAHELEHALADSALDFPKLDLEDPQRADEATAGRSLLEGDASLLMQQYGAAAFTPEDASELLSDPAVTEGLEESEDVPFVLQRSLEFPYDEGLRFACRLFSKGGWEAIDRAYDSPPISTAQILLPRLYDREVEPVPAPKISGPGPAWRRSTSASFGMFDLMLMLQAPGGDPVMSAEEALDRAQGWKGGTMKAWTRGDEVALAISIATKRTSEPAPICDHLTDWHDDSFAPVEEVAEGRFRSKDRYTVIECDRGGVRIAMAPTRGNATGLLP